MKNVDGCCKGRTKTGKPCRAAPTPCGLCYFHANPNKAVELGRMGGRSKRIGAIEYADPLPTLDNAVSVRDTVARVIADVYAGKLHPRIASSLEALLNLQLRAIEAATREINWAEHERQMAVSDAEKSLQETLDGNADAPSRLWER